MSHPAISLDSLRQMTPAAFALQPASFVSPDYKFVPTIEIVDFLISEGWVPFQAMQQRSRIPGNEDSTKHKIVFRPKDTSLGETLALGGLIPTVQVINSHNWASRIAITAGMWREVCANGLALIAAMFFGESKRHDSAIESIEIILSRFRSTMAGFLATAEKWVDIQLDSLQAIQFAMEVAKVRFPDPTEDHARALLIPHRQGDALNTLWHVFNTVQENAINGGNKYGYMKRSMRALSNIDLMEKVNTACVESARIFDPIE